MAHFHVRLHIVLNAINAFHDYPRSVQPDRRETHVDLHASMVLSHHTTAIYMMVASGDHHLADGCIIRPPFG
jgi:hypothetical protein